MDTESQSHIFFRDDTEQGLNHLYFNKSFWNHSLLSEGPIGSDIEIKIDSDNTIHAVYTYHPTTNGTENEVRLMRFNQTSEFNQILQEAIVVRSNRYGFRFQ